jgi:hypothetical protein
MHRMLGPRTRRRGRNPVASYSPMTLADLASRLVRTAESKTRWKLVREILEEYRWEPKSVHAAKIASAEAAA